MQNRKRNKWLERNPRGLPFCWQCGKKLERNHRTKELIFATVLIDGNPVKVHKMCEKAAKRCLSLNAPDERAVCLDGQHLTQKELDDLVYGEKVRQQ